MFSQELLEALHDFRLLDGQVVCFLRIRTMIVEFLEEDIPSAEISLPLDVPVVPCPQGHGIQPW